MKTYKINVTYTFRGHFIIEAETEQEARDIVFNDCGLNFGEIHTSNPDAVIDWDFDMTPTERIKP